MGREDKMVVREKEIGKIIERYFRIWLDTKSFNYFADTDAGLTALSSKNHDNGFQFFRSEEDYSYVELMHKRKNLFMQNGNETKYFVDSYNKIAGFYWEEIK